MLASMMMLPVSCIVNNTSGKASDKHGKDFAPKSLIIGIGEPLLVIVGLEYINT